MRPLSALISLQLCLKNGGICVVLRSPGWHEMGALRVPEEAKGAAGSS